MANQYFLGYAFASVLLPFLGGNGPTIEMGPLQRQIQPEAINRLVGIAGQAGEGLFRHDPAHALTFVIEPEAVDLESLTGQHTGPFKDVLWRPEYEGVAKQYGGLHRIAVLRRFFKDTLVEYKKANAKAAKYPTQKEYRDDANSLECTLNEKGKWLIAFYDGWRSISHFI